MFVVVNSIEDEQVVLNEGRSDIKPLNIDILDVSSNSVPHAPNIDTDSIFPD